jgi:Tfp pilus assembly protein PilV
MLKLSDVGDTLVEVLIASSIVGFILVGAYVAVNHNVTVELQSQERSSALELDQIQIEKLRALVINDSNYLSSQPTSSPFCIGGGGVNSTSIEPSGNCNFSTGDVWSSSPSTTPNYEVTISATNSANWDQITVTATWTAIGTDAPGVATLDYRFYPSILSATIPVGNGV